MKHDVLLAQLEDVLAEYERLRATSQHDDLSDLPLTCLGSKIKWTRPARFCVRRSD
jgi:hypothetical protein